jgi:hypothetical protein
MDFMERDAADSLLGEYMSRQSKALEGEGVDSDDGGGADSKNLNSFCFSPANGEMA